MMAGDPRREAPEVGVISGCVRGGAGLFTHPTLWAPARCQALFSVGG